MTPEETKQIADVISQAVGTAVYKAVLKALEDTADTEGAALAMGVSESFIEHNIRKIPHHQVGTRNVFSKRVLREFGKKYNNI